MDRQMKETMRELLPEGICNAITKSMDASDWKIKLLGLACEDVGITNPKALLSMVKALEDVAARTPVVHTREGCGCLPCVARNALHEAGIEKY